MKKHQEEKKELGFSISTRSGGESRKPESSEGIENRDAAVHMETRCGGNEIPDS